VRRILTAAVALDGLSDRDFSRVSELPAIVRCRSGGGCEPGGRVPAEGDFLNDAELGVSRRRGGQSTNGGEDGENEVEL
jgi:hypothetical protein